MSGFFPRTAVDWRLEEPAALRRVSLSLPLVATLTGVLLRLYRAAALPLASDAGWLAFAAAVAFGAVFFIGMATLHLGNFPLARWYWRAPLFGLIAAGAELATSLLLTLAGAEPLGSGRAVVRDWSGMVVFTLLTRTLVVVLFAALLAAVVQLVRRWLVHRDDRGGTLRMAQEEQLRHSGNP